MKDNIASIKVLEKLGMAFTTTFDFDRHEGVVYELGQSRYFSYLHPIIQQNNYGTQNTSTRYH